MKKFLLLLVLLCSAVAARAQLNTYVTATSICAGSNIQVNIQDTTTNYQQGNQFIVQLSDSSGDFSSPTVIGGFYWPVQIYPIPIYTIPANTPPGTGYRIRTISTIPAVIGADNGTDITIVESPTITASAVDWSTPQHHRFFASRRRSPPQFQLRQE